MAMRVFAVIGVAVLGMLITGAAAELIGPAARFIGIAATTIAIFITWSRMKSGERG